MRVLHIKASPLAPTAAALQNALQCTRIYCAGRTTASDADPEHNHLVTEGGNAAAIRTGDRPSKRARVPDGYSASVPLHQATPSVEDPIKLRIQVAVRRLYKESDMPASYHRDLAHAAGSRSPPLLLPENIGGSGSPLLSLTSAAPLPPLPRNDSDSSLLIPELHLGNNHAEYSLQPPAPSPLGMAEHTSVQLQRMSTGQQHAAVRQLPASLGGGADAATEASPAAAAGSDASKDWCMVDCAEPTMSGDGIAIEHITGSIIPSPSAADPIPMQLDFDEVSSPRQRPPHAHPTSEWTSHGEARRAAHELQARSMHQTAGAAATAMAPLDNGKCAVA